MKNLAIILGFIFSLQSFATDVTFLCNDQNSHSIYRLQLSENLAVVRLITLIGDSSVLAAGTRDLKMEEGESSPELTTYGGKTNTNLHVALLFNSRTPSDIFEVTAFFQQQKGDILSGKTLLLCGKN